VVRGVALLVLAACGRLGFGTDAAPGDSGGGGGGDGSAAAPPALVTAMAAAQFMTTSLSTGAIDVAEGTTLIAAIACHACKQTASVASITGGGATWNQIAAGPAGGIGGSEVIWIYLGTDVTAGSTTVSIATTVSDDFEMTVSEWSGLTGAVDTSGMLLTDSGATAVAPTLVTTHASDVVYVAAVGFPGNLPGGTTSDGSTFLPGSELEEPLAAAYRIVTTTGTYAPTWAMQSPTYAVGAAFEGY